MPRIILDDEQVKIISESCQTVEIADRSGQIIGYFAHGFTEEDIAIAKERLASDEPRYSTRDVLDHLHSLEG